MKPKAHVTDWLICVHLLCRFCRCATAGLLQAISDRKNVLRPKVAAVIDFGLHREPVAFACLVHFLLCFLKGAVASCQCSFFFFHFFTCTLSLIGFWPKDGFELPFYHMVLPCVREAHILKWYMKSRVRFVCWLQNWGILEPCKRCNMRCVVWVQTR